MKAVLIRKHGGPEVLEIADLPKPKAEAGQVVIRVKAAGMNHLDTWVRRGLPGVTPPLPMVLGSDAAGLIEEIGPGVTGLEAGDRVFVAPGFSCGRCAECCSGNDPLCRDYGILGEHRNGTQAEYAALPAANVMSLPDGLSFEEGAAFPLVFLTAWHMLVGRARVRLGEDVLVQAGGSGVGTAAIQIARLHGARVFTTVGSDDKMARVRELGAEAAINYRTADFLEEVRRLTGKRGVDVVIESIGQQTWERSLKALARGGRLVTCGATSGYRAETDLRFVFSKGLSLLGSTMGSRAELLKIARLVGERRLKPVIDRVLPLERVADGHRAIAERSLFGKIVLKP
ncbi:MAG: alcohol dehydrogenase [Acidobacteria bacterium]|nr:MAG: alcohol dehydrogenase [Acidobacteriota bacterium]